jgi:hypothetical protein
MATMAMAVAVAVAGFRHIRLLTELIFLLLDLVFFLVFLFVVLLVVLSGGFGDQLLKSSLGKLVVGITLGLFKLDMDRGWMGHRHVRS